MVLYGVALLAGCLITGLLLGELLGAAIGVEANVGGVGIAMLLLIFISHKWKKYVIHNESTFFGIKFWSAMYIPIIVAMAAKQNVIGALKGGYVAVLAGVLTTIVSFALVPLLKKTAEKKSSNKEGSQISAFKINGK